MTRDEWGCLMTYKRGKPMADDADEANYDHLRTYEPPALMVAPEAESRIGGGRLLVALILAFALWALIWAGVATWL